MNHPAVAIAILIFTAIIVIGTQIARWWHRPPGQRRRARLRYFNNYLRRPYPSQAKKRRPGIRCANMETPKYQYRGRAHYI